MNLKTGLFLDLYTEIKNPASYICENHFEKTDVLLWKGVKRFKPNAVPLIFNPSKIAIGDQNQILVPAFECVQVSNSESEKLSTFVDA